MTALCPVAGKPGKRVPPVTVRSLVRERRLPDVEAREWFLCRLPDCEVVYFSHDGETLSKKDLKIRVGLKETDAPHPICYCFGHTAESIREEIRLSRQSTVAASITARVQAGECSCETLNPKGSCCLGDVRKAAREAFALENLPVREVAATAPSPTSVAHDCCATPLKSGEWAGNRSQMVPDDPGIPTSPPKRTEALTLAGSFVAAILASACCIGPLVLAMLGLLGGAAFAVALEPYRPYFIGLTVLLLAGAFYFVYRTPAQAECGPDGTCTSAPRRTRLKVLLWAVGLLVLATLTFPYYIEFLV